uniref:hypothetical protein n=1 Tax=Promicromonospora sp. CA-289581 TaxID=3240013 RepID=UPI003F498B83
MTDPTRRAIDLTHDAVDALAASIKSVQANPSSNGDGGLPAFDAVLAGISAYLLDPVAVAGTLAGIDGERKAAAAFLLEATDGVRDLALYRLAQEAESKDVRVSLQGIAGGISVSLDEAAQRR